MSSCVPLEARTGGQDDDLHRGGRVRHTTSCCYCASVFNPHCYLLQSRLGGYATFGRNSHSTNGERLHHRVFKPIAAKQMLYELLAQFEKLKGMSILHPLILLFDMHCAQNVSCRGFSRSPCRHSRLQHSRLPQRPVA